MNKISGVYKITNKVTGDFYIGSSKNIKKRWIGHKSPSVWKRHLSSKLYKDMIQFGLDNFLFEIIEETDNLKGREQNYIDLLHPSYNNIRAKDTDIERQRKADKEYKKSHKEDYRIKSKEYNHQLCSYEGEILTLKALSSRFVKCGIAHPTLEAKKYLINGII